MTFTYGMHTRFFDIFALYHSRSSAQYFADYHILMVKMTNHTFHHRACQPIYFPASTILFNASCNPEWFKTHCY